jgi:hypothetical protein
MATVSKATAFTMERYGRLPDMDRSFDIAYWQRLGPAAIFEAAWQMAVDAHALSPGGPHELRLQRMAESFKRQNPDPAATSVSTTLASCNERINKKA